MFKCSTVKNGQKNQFSSVRLLKWIVYSLNTFDICIMKIIAWFRIWGMEQQCLLCALRLKAWHAWNLIPNPITITDGWMAYKLLTIHRTYDFHCMTFTFNIFNAISTIPLTVILKKKKKKAHTQNIIYAWSFTRLRKLNFSFRFFFLLNQQWYHLDAITKLRWKHFPFWK